MEGQAVISDEVLARYAADAAAEIEGASLHGGKPVDASVGTDGMTLAVHVDVEWGRSASDVGAALQSHVREYVERMTNGHVGAVDVIVERVGPAPSP